MPILIGSLVTVMNHGVPVSSSGRNGWNVLRSNPIYECVRLKGVIAADSTNPHERPLYQQPV